jgi:GNAT superfamily N-acetyltransferase
MHNKDWLQADNGMNIRELIQEEDAKVAAFLLALDEHDRYWRFCRPMTDAALRAYAGRIDWKSVTVLGAFDGQAQLAGILELCDNGAAAEIAVAVAPAHRGHGVGRALMDRALLEAKVQRKDRVMLLCLVDNEPMRRLARSAGLAATAEGGAVEGTLALEHTRPGERGEAATHHAGALYSHTCAELFERSMSAPAAKSATQKG